MRETSLALVFKWGCWSGGSQIQVSISVSKRKMQSTLNNVFQSMEGGGSYLPKRLLRAEAGAVLPVSGKACTLCAARP